MYQSPIYPSARLRRCFTAVGAALLLTTLASVAMAEPPAFFSKMFRKKAPAGPLELKVEHGPWLIMAVVISDGDAQKQANALALELRETLRMPTFVMQRSSGTPLEVAQRERTRTDLDTGLREKRSLEARYVHGGVTEGYAVLVGEFVDDEDSRIEKTLLKLRTLQPQALAQATAMDSDGRDPSSNWMVQKYRQLNWSQNDRNKGLGPMGRAFLTRNPLLPAEYFLDTPKLSSFVTSLNKDVEHSLLDCPGKYTVRVATFTGKESTGLGSVGQGTSQSVFASDILDRAALRAHQLTDLLREKNIEAYEFHDKFGSYVSIGSFDSLGSETNGEFRYNPQMAAVAQKYCGYRDVEAVNPITRARMKTTTLNYMGKIPFDIEGKPMAVPRKSAGIYGGSLLGRN